MSGKKEDEFYIRERKRHLLNKWRVCMQAIRPCGVPQSDFANRRGSTVSILSGEDDAT